MTALTRSPASLRPSDLIALARSRCGGPELITQIEATRLLAAQPGIAPETMTALVFITGLHRTGTTLLHNLLARRDRNRAVLARARHPGDIRPATAWPGPPRCALPDLLADPIAVAARVCSFAGILCPPAAERRMRGILTRAPRGGRETHRYLLQDYGLHPRTSANASPPTSRHSSCDPSRKEETMAETMNYERVARDEIEEVNRHAGDNPVKIGRTRRLAIFDPKRYLGASARLTRQVVADARAVLGQS